MQTKSQQSLPLYPEGNTVDTVIKRIRQESRDEREKGTWFENLVKQILLDDQTFEFTRIHTFLEWPEREILLPHRTGLDLGIDLVGVRRDGRFVAIQCKCYDENRTIRVSDIANFIADSQIQVFALGYIITTCRWNTNAERKIENLKTPLHRIDIYQYSYRIVKNQVLQSRPVPSPRPDQNIAIQRVLSGLSRDERGQIVMACGSGKTLTALWITQQYLLQERIENGLILFFAPSIALVSQTRREWLRHTKITLDCRVICSDKGAGGRGESAEIQRLSEFECDVSNNPKHIADFLNEKKTKNPKIIFSTYQSIEVITQAQREHGAPNFHLTIMDEAHRTAGAGKKKLQTRLFQQAHYDKYVKTEKRLYMTATPRIYSPSSKRSLRSKNIDIIDMDDKSIYGPLWHKLSFREAVEQDLLSDYRIIVLGMRDDIVTPGIEQRIIKRTEEEKAKQRSKSKYPWLRSDMAKVYGGLLAINGVLEGSAEDLPRDGLFCSIGFSNSREKSRDFKIAFSDEKLKEWTTNRIRLHYPQRASDSALKLEVEHLDATNSIIKRNKALRELESAKRTKTPRMLCNVGLFTEGVDVPSLDAILFLEPRKSQVDIIQAVGRVMRRAQGKRYGYIVLPIYVPAGKNLENELETGSEGYESIIKVLSALRSHDTRIEDDPLKFISILEARTENSEKEDKLSKSSTLDSDGQDLKALQQELQFNELSANLYAYVLKESGLLSTGENIAREIEYAVKSAAAIFNKGDLAKPLAEALDLATPDNNTEANNICCIAALLICNACMMHKRLKKTPNMQMLPHLLDINTSDCPQEQLVNSWNAILRVDFAPIFQPAMAAMKTLSPARKFVNDALSYLLECAHNIADKLGNLGLDHAGPLYHRILPHAKSDGAFYTLHESALLLASLALDDDFCDWSDLKTVKKLRIMDPACGTGTLLTAAMHTIKTQIAKHVTLSESEQADFHKDLVENSICGLDINRHAVQMAASNLTLGSPTIDYKKMNLFTMSHGPQKDGSVKAGSLELLATAEDETSLLSLARPLRDLTSLDSQQVDQAASVDFPLKDLDLVIMNPPFTSNTNRNKKLAMEDVRKMQAHELALRDHVKAINPYAGELINSNTLESYFTPLANQLLNKDWGTLAQIIPVTACLSPATLKKRQFLAKRFWVKYIIASHDPQRPNFSGASSIHESLIVMHRYKSRYSKPPTKFITLLHAPRTADEAIKLSNHIKQDLAIPNASIVY